VNSLDIDNVAVSISFTSVDTESMGKLEKINVYQNLQDSYTDYVLAS
jgi:hypothetical protein